MVHVLQVYDADGLPEILDAFASHFAVKATAQTTSDSYRDNLDLERVDLEWKQTAENVQVADAWEYPHRTDEARGNLLTYVVTSLEVIA
jgi:hypothetical protein